MAQVIVGLKNIEDVELVNAVLLKSEEMRINADENGGDTVVDQVPPVEADSPQIVLKEGATETQFWAEFVTYTLLDDNCYDNFIAGKSLTAE